jgi:hypothetical protein
MDIISGLKLEHRLGHRNYIEPDGVNLNLAVTSIWNIERIQAF